ncbi:hypothetical protein PanWU01x14_131550 [Parasponia andersonii]|uniref:Uncharacterized protein n=1 Tax=Parasponia andersonii TaxID=3476 RepID=A0A2P5CR41_PARAD|nr:hypothetical protein PanWU01x14_131550 [Parasponia andersonii]
MYTVAPPTADLDVDLHHESGRVRLKPCHESGRDNLQLFIITQITTYTGGKKEGST